MGFPLGGSLATSVRWTGAQPIAELLELGGGALGLGPGGRWERRPRLCPRPLGVSAGAGRRSVGGGAGEHAVHRGQFLSPERLRGYLFVVETAPGRGLGRGGVDH